LGENRKNLECTGSVLVAAMSENEPMDDGDDDLSCEEDRDECIVTAERARLCMRMPHAEFQLPSVPFRPRHPELVIAGAAI